MLLPPLFGLDLGEAAEVVQLFSELVGLPQQLLDRPVLLPSPALFLCHQQLVGNNNKKTL